ncbi:MULTISPECIES: HAMP domain-containing sensor histidine kinase [unclassified Streptomyces]|uniref:HAMP domain-containing sensor histidine kinase n=1 Tax=unclassified Streptomyces TaxID=2593676 RepID=UPI000883A046|nr:MULTISPECIES: HAMP domain-containing sensor histidine kinase [unclassified Streptomyces]PBC84230.1 two-component system sensor histidine kinase MprB [Streptomyces sp. 2321.6]SDR33501.1 two-component system, OmpR family, sensor histidine kinase MprB [Streptomyces sp. KS_16]SED24257.1 two-component system, OmpR family, sensor histidine kinase MprB [Streptomyces sp. 2133.1]SEE57905.1 two-component system, OmpR family, sensor histidine kinase MprB [Streptomyces sp. 2112.3]SNC70313.1 two-compone
MTGPAPAHGAHGTGFAHSRLGARIARLPLRSRLTLLTAVAVAVAVAVSALACWLLTRAQLRDEVDNSLQNVGIAAGYLQETYTECRPTDPTESKNAPPSYFNVQIVQVDGSRCIGPNSQPVQVQRSDVAVAQGVQRDTLHDAVTPDGTDVRVLTKHIGVQGVQFAVSISRPLTEVDSALNRLALLLAAVAGLGVIGAGTAGLVIARSGLKPVDRLTGAVEHVARTQDLTIRIPADGEDEIARLSRSFNAMTAALAASRDLQQQLIADAGHELRTPLTSLRTNIDLLVRSEQAGRPIPAADKAALLASVKAQMGELAALIGDLQELSRPPAPGQSAIEVVALHEIVGSGLQRARLRGPSLTIAADLAPWYVRAEPAALERAVVNLLDNAVKFSPPGGTVEVRLAGGELTVRDHGPGIPQDELPHVFERFWRSPSARSLPGSGLGLSIVARTAEQAGGAVRLRSADLGGTEAVLTLPGAATPPPGIPEPGMPEPPRPQGPPPEAQ